MMTDDCPECGQDVGICVCGDLGTRLLTYEIELGGIITRDIVRRECEAAVKEEVRRICAQEMPYYCVREIRLVSGHSDGTTPAVAGGSTERSDT